MAADYYAAAQALATQLDNSSLLNGVQVSVEGEHDFRVGLAPWIGVYLERRDPAPNQPLNAGLSTRYRLRFSVWCWAMSMESVRAAAEARDDLVVNAERALMADRTLGGAVDMSWLEGGELPSGRLDPEAGTAVYLSGGEIVLTAELSAGVT